MILFKKILHGVILPALLAALAGCAAVSRTDFPTTSSAQEAELPAYVHVIPLTPENIRQFTARAQMPAPHGGNALPSSRTSWQYNIGVGDVLSITVWDHPELALDDAQQRNPVDSGNVVDENGTIFYPYIGRVRVAGRLVGDVQRELTERLQEYVADPQVDVKVVAYNAHKVVVTGAVARPQSLPITNIALTLLEAINAAGGLSEAADDQHVTIRRNGQTYSINLRAFMENGQAGNNPVLHGGDIVNVPLAEPQRAFLLGRVSQPGIVELGPHGMNLTEAIAHQGGLDEVRADASGIFVFRNQPDRIDVFQLDARSPLAFVLATQFALRPDDVVYVVTDPAVRWNEIIAQIFPTISALRQAQLIGSDL